MRNETVKEMFMGMGLYGLAVLALGLLFTESPFRYGVGLALGLLMGCLAVWHMYRGLDVGLDLGQGAAKYIIGQNRLRYGLIVVFYGIICVTEAGSPVAAFLGIMGIKAGAYLQPLIHKLYYKQKRR